MVLCRNETCSSANDFRGFFIYFIFVGEEKKKKKKEDVAKRRQNNKGKKRQKSFFGVGLEASFREKRRGEGGASNDSGERTGRRV